MRYPVIIGLIAIFFSCHKHPDLPYQPAQVCSGISSNVDSVNKYIHGRWNYVEEKRWDRSTFSFQYITPQTKGYIENITIADSTITFYKNFIRIGTYKFKVVKESDLFTIAGDDAFFVFLDPKTNYITNVVPISACSQFLVFHFEAISDFTGAITYKK